MRETQIVDSALFTPLKMVYCYVNKRVSEQQLNWLIKIYLTRLKKMSSRK